MASNRPAPGTPAPAFSAPASAATATAAPAFAAPAFSYEAYGVPSDTDGPQYGGSDGFGRFGGPADGPSADAFSAGAPSTDAYSARDAFSAGAFGAPAASAEEWNPTEESLVPLRGKHRVAKQRGSLARSSTVLGVGVIAAVGAGGIATAQEKPAVSISLPDQLTDSLESLADSLPDAESLPGLGALVSGSGAGTGADADSGTDSVTAAVPASATSAPAGAGQGIGAGESLRARILHQAEQQRSVADEAAHEAAREQAVKDAAAEAKKQREEADAKAEKVEKAKAEAKAEAEAKAKAAAEAKAEAERLAKLAASYSLPTSSYTLTSTFGQSGSMWSSGHHTGLDFAAPTGTPVKAVHGGTIKSAGYSGSYGYRIVLELSDGTEIWYCHLSQMNVSAGSEVSTGETIGNVGATGNVTGPHLHLEVHTPGGDGIDPAAWLRGKGLTV